MKNSLTIRPVENPTKPDHQLYIYLITHISSFHRVRLTRKKSGQEDIRVVQALSRRLK